MDEELTQLALDIPGGPGAVKVVRRRRQLPIVKCLLCKKDVVSPYLAGSYDPNGEGYFPGLRLKLDPEPVEAGEFYIVGKTAHRRREEDIHPSFLFYVEHECVAEFKK
jgi:hypothetical protein